MSLDFLYEVGDRVLINCEPPDDPEDMWSDGFNNYIGCIGTVVSIYERSDEDNSYDLLEIKFEWSGTVYQYVFYASSLAKHDAKLTRGSSVRILRRHNSDHGSLDWSEKMDKTIGLYGKIIDISKKAGEYWYMYKVQTEDQYGTVFFYYYAHSIMECAPELLEKTPKKQWVLMEDGTIVFRVIKTNPDGTHQLMDKIGRKFESSKLRIKDAPPECTGFEFVKDQPEFFRV